MKERWKPVAGYLAYAVSNLGRVCYVKKFQKSGRCLKPDFVKGYPRVRFHHPKGPRFFVHQLVAAAFIGPCPSGHEINHIDGAHSNARVDNLEYLTPAQNKAHAKENGFYAHGDRNAMRLYPEKTLKGERNGNSKLTPEIVKSIRERYAKRKSLQRELAQEFGVSMVTIHAILHRRTWRHV